MLALGRFLIGLTVFAYFVVLALIVYGMRYSNPYRLIMVFGKKGSGKTTLIAKLTVKYLRRGWKVYSTVPIPGALLFNAQDIGKIMFDENTVMFIDEGGMLFDNRNFKSFREDTRDWFKLQRHYRVKVFIFSQAFDIDVKLRNLTDYMYLTNTYFNTISIARQVTRKICIVHPSGESESRIADDLDFSPWWKLPFGGCFVTWIPKYIKYFDSYDAPKLEPGEFSLCPYPDDFEERFLKYKIWNGIYTEVCKIGDRVLNEYWRLRFRFRPPYDEEIEENMPIQIEELEMVQAPDSNTGFVNTESEEEQ